MHGEYKMSGGKLVVIDLDVREGRLANVQLSGDFFLEPDSALRTIDAALEGRPADMDEASRARSIRDALAPDVMMYGISPEAIAVAVCRALQAEHAA
jgi:lipoate-protein ligase A